MKNLDHLFPTNTAQREDYTYARTVVSAEFKLPPRDDRVGHGSQLKQAAEQAAETAKIESENLPSAEQPKGLVLDFSSEPDFKLQLASLELTRSGIELRSSRIVPSPADPKKSVMHATVFIPEGKLGIFIRKFEAYCAKDTPGGKPKNRELVESIGQIRLASLESFWTDTGTFPTDDQAHWWEVWLQDTNDTLDVVVEFKRRAGEAGVFVAERQLRFPERRVLLAKATVAQLVVVKNLFDVLAELRLAKLMTSEFLQLPPASQLEFIEEAQTRLQWFPESNVSVCLLDTGVNRGHPLLIFALAEKDAMAVDPNWPIGDLRGHGTEMAGIALYGCLREHLGGNEPILVVHHLESVKILPDQGANDPDLYGDITSQAISRIEIAAEERDRVHCLAVTADSRDEGYPSSWSAALDQISFGEGEANDPRRLIMVSAGNLPLDNRHEYPDRNLVAGVEDPAQSWNALTVGAYTEKVSILEQGFDNWQTIAPSGSLSPCSRTSTIWSNKSWPLKPEIVMEGGNNAIDPTTARADHVDDLSMLTTRVSPDGALLTATGDTSAATAGAARYAAMIWARYPSLWPETVRALLVHSARWSDAMLSEFPHQRRHARLRCYGYGVPNIERALWSASNATTLIIEGTLQPYEQDGDNNLKTKDMHLHQLPWPQEVLESLGETEVRMRITLSYFIEPSPGRRGWKRKHRYQSHGLRFDVKRPTETIQEFQKRISKADWADDDQVEQGTDEREWELGDHFRRKGSLHSDTWIGTAADLASSGVLAVFPVTGWWKERKHLNCWEKKARYSLIVSIETHSSEVDLYTPIAAQIGVATQIPSE
jgi:hypothetical protein